MGSIVSVDSNTALGASLLGRKFRTKGVTCFGYTGYDKRYYLTKWEDRSSLANPHPDTFELQIKDHIEFVITSVSKKTGISPMITIQIEILNNIPLSLIGVTREGSPDSRWCERNHIESIQNSFLPSNDGSYLLIRGLEAVIYWFHFGFNLSATQEINQPCTIQNIFLDEIL